MRAIWRVLVQPPSNLANKDLGEWVGKTPAEIAKYLRQNHWFSPKTVTTTSITGSPVSGISMSQLINPYPDQEYDFSHAVTSIEIEQTDRKADMCTINLFDPQNIYANIFETGLLVTVSGGWSVEDGAGELFRGIIHEVVPSFKNGNRSTVKLICLEDMIRLGAVEEDDPPISSDGEMDEGGEEVIDPEQGKYADIIKVIAKKHNLKCDDEDVQLTPPYPANSKESPNQGPKMTDLARLYNLADQCYAAVYVEGDRLKFITLTRIFDTFKAQCNFLYREIGSRDVIGFTNDLFAMAKTLNVYVEEVKIVNGRPRKKVKVAAATGKVIPQSDVVGAPRADFGKSYKPDDEKLRKLSEEQRDELRGYVSPRNIMNHKVEWKVIKDYFIVVEVEHKPESQSASGVAAASHKAELKSDDRILNTGVQLKLPIGYWKLRPITVATLAGVGMKYSGAYYLSMVTHSLSPKGYSCQVEGLRYAANLPGATIETQQTSGAPVPQ